MKKTDQSTSVSPADRGRWATTPWPSESLCAGPPSGGKDVGGEGRGKRWERGEGESLRGKIHLRPTPTCEARPNFVAEPTRRGHPCGDSNGGGHPAKGWQPARLQAAVPAVVCKWQRRRCSHGSLRAAICICHTQTPRGDVCPSHACLAASCHPPATESAAAAACSALCS